jgi:hypothetical protein
MDYAWKSCYDWRNGRWEGLEQAARYVESLQGPLDPKQIATMLRALIDIEEKLSVFPNEMPAWKEYIRAAGRESHQG